MTIHPIHPGFRPSDPRHSCLGTVFQGAVLQPVRDRAGIPGWAFFPLRGRLPKTFSGLDVYNIIYILFSN